MNRSSCASVLLVLAAGCYGHGPHGRPPAIPLPELRTGAGIEVSTERVTTIEDVPKTSETCPQGQTTGGPDCIVTHYTEREPVEHVTTTATYDGEPINYGQFRVLTDPDRDAKLARLDDLARKCRRADKARWVGMISSLAGVTAFTIGMPYGSKPTVIAGEVAMLAGLTSYAVGYYALGGRQCNEANDLYRELDVSDETGFTEAYGEDYATTMKELADEFNARAEATARE